jgi:farnesyl-diphosphate farnesyltransferase
MLEAGEDCADLALLQREILPDHSGEGELIAQLDRCLRWLRSLEAADRDEIVKVLKKIIRGQTLDLKRFGADTDGVRALQTASELDEYTYLVAGSVGDFWTRICFRHLPRYAALPCEPLSQLGVSYGKGLQLVNILRDLPADLRAGRCYLPEDELRAAGVSLPSLVAEPVRCRPVFNSWLNRAATQLEEGRLYIRALRPVRLRAGCFLPWYLGEKTLQLMRQHAPLETSAKIKVPRGTVRAGMALACVAAFFNMPLRAG